MTFVLASNNLKKRREMGQILQAMGIQVLTMEEAGIHSEPEEDGSTFEENALIKARAAHEASGGMATLADDSGLVVDALDGAPGVYSSRYAGGHGDDEANNRKLLAELADVPEEERTARFVCVLAFVDEDGSELLAEGTVEGIIGFEPRGANGFGYDPLFLADAFDRELTTAEVSADRKNAISHRGNALRALKPLLEANV